MAEIPWGGEDFVTDPPEEERIRYYSRAEVDEAVAKERAAAFAAGVQAGREAAARKAEEYARTWTSIDAEALEGLLRAARDGGEERPRYKLVGNRVTLACDDCGTLNNFHWTAPDDVWAAVTAQIKDQPHPVLCAPCFATRAEAAGVAEFWDLIPARLARGDNQEEGAQRPTSREALEDAAEHYGGRVVWPEEGEQQR